jgi:hypothetical protein
MDWDKAGTLRGSLAKVVAIPVEFGAAREVRS